MARSCVLLLGSNGPWDGLVAAILIGSVVGIVDVSAMVNLCVGGSAKLQSVVV